MDQAGDQKARDDEEHIDANETAGELPKPIVVENDGDNRDGAQPINVGPVHGFSAWLRGWDFKKGHPAPIYRIRRTRPSQTYRPGFRFTAKLPHGR
jgi:hypothetical protein